MRPTTTVRAQSRASRSRSILGVVLLASALVVMSCSGVEDAPADMPSETTTSAADTETTTSSMTEKESSDSAKGAVGTEVSLEWTEADMSGTTSVGHLLFTEDGFVAYSFAHEAGAWESPDGVRWTPRDLVFEAESDELAVYLLTVGGPGYVAMGSDPATITSDDHPAVWISDDGFSWERHDHIVENPPLGRFAEISLMSVVGGPDGRLILVGRMDPEEGAFDEHEFVVWTSDDGLEWSLKSDTFPSGSYIDDPVYATSLGFIANGFVEGGGSGETAWLSVDGEQWEQLPLDFTGEESYETAVIRGSTRRVVSWDDRILTVAGTPDGIGLWVSGDGGTWTSLTPSPALSHTPNSIIRIDDVAAGPAGIVMTGRYEPRPPEPQPVTVEKDQRVLTVDFETGVLTVTDLSDGAVLLEIELEDAEPVTRTDDESLTLIDPDGGEELISVTLEEWAQALEEAGLGPPDDGDDRSLPVLWFSPDGERWTVVDVEETFGTDHSPSEVVVGGESVLVKWDGLELNGYEEDEITGELEDPPAVIWVAKLVDPP